MRILEEIGQILCAALSFFALALIIIAGVIWRQELRHARQVRNNYSIGALHERKR